MMYHIPEYLAGLKLGELALSSVWRILNLAILLPAIVLLESEEPLHVCTLGSRGPILLCYKLVYIAPCFVSRSIRARLRRVWLGVAHGIYYWRNLFCRFSHQLPTRQIESPRQIFPLYGKLSGTWYLLLAKFILPI